MLCRFSAFKPVEHQRQQRRAYHYEDAYYEVLSTSEHRGSLVPPIEEPQGRHET